MKTVLVNDIMFKFVDSIGYRRCVAISEIASFAGLVGLVFVPEPCPDPFVGILICSIIYVVGSGLIEVFCSPIVEVCPFDHRDAIMSLLHSFYCWGSVGVILLSTVFSAVFGIDHWKWLVVI